MENFRLVLKKRILAFGLMEIVLALLLVGTITGVYETGERTGFTSGVLNGFQGGLLSSLIVIFCILIVHYTIIMKDDHKLKQQYHLENDERRREIQLKSGGGVMLISSILMIVGGIIGGYFNEIVFYSLVGCGVVQVLLVAILKIIYSKKI